MTTAGSVAPLVKVGGTELPGRWLRDLIGVRIDRGLGVIGRATLRFYDDDLSHADDALFGLGKSVTISQQTTSERGRAGQSGELFSGTVTGVSLEQLETGPSHFVVVVDDPTYKLTLGTKVQTHLNTTFSDVVRKIAQQAGLSSTVDSDGGPTHEYLMQAGSAMSFINTIAARIGYVWWYDDGKLQFRKAGTSTGTAELKMRANLSEFTVRASALRPTAVSVSGWDSANQQNIVGTAITSTGTKQSNFVAKYVQTQTALGAAATATPDPSPGSQSEAKAAATATYHDSLSAAVVARGTCDVNSAITPGSTVNVTNAGSASGKYLVSEVQHTYSPKGFFTHFVAGPNRGSGLVDTLGRTAPDPGFAVNGMVIASVTNVKDPDNLGRVKVRYNGLGDQIESTWARMLSESGGKDRGTVFMPEVNDEVLVGFEHSDSRKPIVLGCLFSKKNTLPEASTLIGGAGTVDYRRITSRKGYVLEFADGTEPAKQHILLTVGAHKLRLGADEATLEVASGKPITIKAGNAKFAISNSGDVTIEGVNVTIKASATLKLETQAQGDIKSSGPLNIQGAVLSVKGTGTATVEASGPLALKGAMVAIN